MQVLTAAEMAETDRRSADQGVPVAVLMENAGAAVARFVQRHFPGRGLVVALCGRANNGGDGFVAARKLAGSGRSVRVVLLGKAEDVKGEAAAALEGLRQSEANGLEFVAVNGIAGLREALAGAELVLDAVVGTGFKPPLRELAAGARGVLAESAVPVVAVDLPSGWDTDSIEQRGESGDRAAFRASAVVTFVAPKRAHVFGHLTPGETFGPVVVAAIGTPAAAMPPAGDLRWAGTAKRLAEAPRGINGNKGKFGHVLIVGGSVGKAGAPSMASLACMRTGAGLTTAAVPREILPTVAAVAPELMVVLLEGQGTGNREQGSGNREQETGSRQGESAAEAREAHLAGATEVSGGLELAQLEPKKLEALLKGIKVVAIGPGLGQEGSTPEFVRKFVERCTLPMVIDADALNAFAGKAHLLGGFVRQAKVAGAERTLVLTPHPGEMARLLEVTVKEVEADREKVARRFAQEYGVTLVLKGWRTLIAHPDGAMAVNTTGNPSMAKGGSGDILTGIVAAMLAQYPDDVAEAVEAAVFLHGLAGDFACAEQDEHTVLATDTVRHLWRAFRARVTDADGFTWIAGQAAASRERKK